MKIIYHQNMANKTATKLSGIIWTRACCYYLLVVSICSYRITLFIRVFGP